MAASNEWTRIRVLHGESGVTATGMSGEAPDPKGRTGSDQRNLATTNTVTWRFGKQFPFA